MAKERISTITIPFRIAFPEVFTPKSYEEGKTPKYGFYALFPANETPLINDPTLYAAPSVGIAGIRALIAKTASDKWGARMIVDPKDATKQIPNPTYPAAIRALDMKTYLSNTGKDGFPLRLGEAVLWDGFAGNVFARFSTQNKPGIVDADTAAILDQSKMRGGLICRAEIHAYAYDDPKNKGISLGFSHLQILLDDGVTFGAGASAANVFTPFRSGIALDKTTDPFA